MNVVYKPERAGLAAVMRGAELRRFMDGVAQWAATEARRRALTPDAIGGSVGMSEDRWTAIVTNAHRTAIWQEYGSRTITPTRPLRSVLDQVRAADPNRGRGRTSR